MSKDELKKALPEMVMFAKTEDERNHYKKLQSLESDEQLEEEAKLHILQFENKNEYKTAYKTRRT
jgi:hypothetical protein